MNWSTINTPDELERSLTNHRPSDETVESMKTVRRAALEFGTTILTELPEGSRYRSMAITSLEESLQWAMKHLALDPDGRGEPDRL